VPITAIEFVIELFNKLFVFIQLVPEFEEEKTPPTVPANKVFPTAESENTVSMDNPPFTATQFEPLLFDKNTPPVKVAANKFDDCE
jgi:hypothetical protein